MREEVELVPNIPIRQREIEPRVIYIERSIRERVAFVRVVVLVLRQNIIRLELKSVAETLPDTRRETPVSRSPDRRRNHCFIQVRLKETLPAEVQKAGQMPALGVCEIEIHRPVCRDLLLESDVRGIDVRILIIAVENSNSRKTRKRICSDGSGTRTGRRSQQTGPRRRASESKSDVGCIRKKRLLLYAVCRYRTDLGEHVLTSVV